MIVTTAGARETLFRMWNGYWKRDLGFDVCGSNYRERGVDNRKVTLMIIDRRGMG